MPDQYLICVLGDTHVPDLQAKLPYGLLESIRQEKPDLILHSGDVCCQQVLDTLSEIAPVKAVQGNRDFFLGLRLPRELQLEINGIKIGMAHGHLNMRQYLRDLFSFLVLQRKVDHRYYQQMMQRVFPEADLVIYGHTHIQVDEVMNGQRFFNPGSVIPCKKNKYHPQYGLVRISADGGIEIVRRTLV